MVAVLALTSSAACRGGESKKAPPALEASGCPPAAPVAPIPSVPDTGDVVLRHLPAKTTIYPAFHTRLRESSVLPELVADLNRRFRWPRDVIVEVRDCGEINAFYEPEGPRVLVCHDLIDHLLDLFDPLVRDQELADKMAIGATAFITLHEVGHALIDAHRIPVTGREEDAVDQLATWLLATGGDGTEQLALDAATWFAIAHAQNPETTMLWDEHPPDAQRFYNIACWVYGSKPERYHFLVEDGHLPPERADVCQAEVESHGASWQALLAPARVTP